MSTAVAVAFGIKSAVLEDVSFMSKDFPPVFFFLIRKDFDCSVHPAIHHY